MISRTPRINLYAPKTLAVMDQAFAAIWNVLRADDPFRDYAKDGELRIAVGQKLLNLVADGVTDPRRLRQLTVERHPSRALAIVCCTPSLTQTCAPHCGCGNGLAAHAPAWSQLKQPEPHLPRAVSTRQRGRIGAPTRGAIGHGQYRVTTLRSPQAS
jgi:hypothetical protein